MFVIRADSEGLNQLVIAETVHCIVEGDNRRAGKDLGKRQEDTARDGLSLRRDDYRVAEVRSQGESHYPASPAEIKMHISGGEG